MSYTREDEYSLILRKRLTFGVAFEDLITNLYDYDKGNDLVSVSTVMHYYDYQNTGNVLCFLSAGPYSDEVEDLDDELWKQKEINDGTVTFNPAFTLDEDSNPLRCDATSIFC